MKETGQDNITTVPQSRRELYSPEVSQSIKYVYIDTYNKPSDQNCTFRLLFWRAPSVVVQTMCTANMLGSIWTKLTTVGLMTILWLSCVWQACLSLVWCCSAWLAARHSAFLCPYSTVYVWFAKKSAMNNNLKLSGFNFPGSYFKQQTLLFIENLWTQLQQTSKQDELLSTQDTVTKTKITGRDLNVSLHVAANLLLERNTIFHLFGHSAMPFQRM